MTTPCIDRKCTGLMSRHPELEQGMVVELWRCAACGKTKSKVRSCRAMGDIRYSLERDEKVV